VAELSIAAACHSGPRHGVSLRQAFNVWLRIAMLSFGGPASQIAIMHRILVEEKRRISDSRFLPRDHRLVNQTMGIEPLPHTCWRNTDSCARRCTNIPITSISAQRLASTSTPTWVPFNGAIADRFYAESGCQRNQTGMIAEQIIKFGALNEEKDAAD
jgi:hypothetical protein